MLPQTIRFDQFQNGWFATIIDFNMRNIFKSMQIASSSGI